MRRRNLVLLASVVVVLSILSAPRRPTAAPRPLLAGAQVPPDVLAILRRSCQDCHSDATHYPWYSYVAPVSLLIRNDVGGGRRHLDLSRWDQYSPILKQRRLSEIANQVKDRDMPLGVYTFIHRDARLSDADIDAIFRWTQAERARLISPLAAP